MATKRVDISQSQFKQGIENVLIAIEENRISWNKNELKKQLDEARKLDKETHDPNHAGRLKALGFLCLHFEDGKEKALAKLKEESTQQQGYATSDNAEKKTPQQKSKATTSNATK